ncbi:MAG: hypothetical protein K1060chlam1_00539 [Candidatus Anoxychlamydiales bacterium]|nr:hypothetical protein [Candidatus Anoxychlamydiales bacterium]
MANISRCFEVFRGFDNSFFFHEKKGKVELAVYDMASKLIYSSELPEGGFSPIEEEGEEEEDENGLRGRVSYLLHRGYTPKYDEIQKRFFLISPTEGLRDYSTVRRSVEDAIAFVEPQVSFEPSESILYTCPITRRLLKDPVVDHHGHTFEKEAIEQWVIKSRSCPLEMTSMQLSDLSPNFALKSIMEALRKTTFKVPSLNLYQGNKDTKSAQGLIKQGMAFEKNEKFDEALDLYRKALVYTNRSRDYSNIPRVLEKMHEEQSACLAYLYLAKYQLNEEANEEALASLIKARDLQKHLVELNKPIAMFFKETRRDEEAFDLFNKMGDSFAKSKEKMDVMAAIEAYQNAILVNPDAEEVYEKLADLYVGNQQKANVYLVAANHFMDKDITLAKKFDLKAYRLTPESPLYYFSHIQLLKKENKIDLLANAYLKLSNVYKTLKDKKNKLLCLRKVVELNPSEQIFKRITKNFLKLGKNKKSLQYFLKWIDFNISEKRWNAAETIAQRALNHFKEDVSILQRLEVIYNNFLNEHLHELLLRLAKALLLRGEVELAKKTYLQTWSRFHDAEAYFEVAQIHINQKNHGEAVKILYELSKHTFFKRNIPLLNKCLKTILQIDPELDLLNSDQQLTFSTFFLVGDLSLQVQALTRRVANNESKNIYQSCAIGDIEHIKQMAVAVKDSSKIKKIIETPNDEGLNLLHIAVLNNQEEIANLLVGFQADVSQCIDPKSKHELAGLSPIDIAAKNGNNALIRLLVRAGAKLAIDGKKTALHFATEKDFFTTVQLLLSYKTPTVLREPDTLYTPLHLAVINKHLGIAKLLLSSKNMDPNLVDSKNHNPLFYAVTATLPDFVRVICESKKILYASDEIDFLLAENKKNLNEENSEKIKEIEKILEQARKKGRLEKEEEEGGED